MLHQEVLPLMKKDPNKENGIKNFVLISLLNRKVKILANLLEKILVRVTDILSKVVQRLTRSQQDQNLTQ